MWDFFQKKRSVGLISLSDNLVQILYFFLATSQWTWLKYIVSAASEVYEGLKNKQFNEMTSSIVMSDNQTEEWCNIKGSKVPIGYKGLGTCCDASPICYR